MRLATLATVVTCLWPSLSLSTQAPPTLVTDPERVIRDTRGGGGSAFRIDSALLGEMRRVTVVLPPSFAVSAPSRRYPVTIVLDGEASVPPVAVVSDELTRHGLIPESVIVAIANTNRLRDLTPPGVSVSGSSLREGGDRFLDFIEKELLPAVDRQFRGTEPRTIVGHSSGGLLATYAAATRATYRNVVAIDTPVEVGQNWVVRQMMTRAAAPVGAIRYASVEARYGWPDAAWAQLQSAAPSAWSLHRERFNTRETHESVPLIGMYLGLREVWKDYSVTAAPTVPTSAVLQYYATLGAGVAPPQRLLGQVVDDLIDEGRGKDARAAFNLLVEHYGRPENESDMGARLADVERRPEPTETVEGLLATPFPTPEQAARYVGDWVGDIWMNPEQPRTGAVTLRIRVSDGRVTGETVRKIGPDGADFVQRWQYLRITPGGLTFGFMNGMRPRGVVLFEGTLQGDVLSGANRFGGINPRGPDGNPPPPLHFEFKKGGGSSS